MGREKQAAAVVVLFPTQQFVFRAGFNFKGCICFPAYTIPDNYPTIYRAYRVSGEMVNPFGKLETQ